MARKTRSECSDKLTKTEMTNKDQPLDADDYRREISNQIYTLQSNSSEQFETLLGEIKNVTVKSHCDIAQIQDDVAWLTSRVTVIVISHRYRMMWLG